MSLSVCCQWLEPLSKRNGDIIYDNIIEEKSLQLGMFKSGKYDSKKISSTYHNNIEQHIKIIPELIKNNISCFRISSSLFPLYEFNRESIHKDDNLLLKMKQLGELFKTNKIRVTTHPGQFCIINSDSDEVIQNSIRELEYHAWMFDSMGFDQTHQYAINIHGGKRGNIEKLINTIKNLPANVKNRLTLENDERCFSVKQLLEVNKETKTPIVFDSHHHQFNLDGMTTEEACEQTYLTWNKNNIFHKPIQHLSNTEPGNENGSFTERRKHSNFIHYIPQCQLDLVHKDFIDLDVEAKMKNIAVLKMRKDFNIIN